MRLFSKLWRDRKGLAAVEFAIIAPVMILLYLGIVELSDAMIANRKVTTVASTIADLVGQATVVNDADMTNIMNAAGAIMVPYNSSTMQLRVTSVNIALNGQKTVGWSSAKNMAPLGTGSTYILPSAIGQNGGSIIVGEVTFTHDAMTVAGEMIFGKTLTFSDKFYLEPRRTLRVTRTSP